MRFGTYHVFQCPPGHEPARVVAEELARAELAEALGFDDVWVPEQHFSPYCLAGDALLLAGHLAARTRRVRIGTAVVNLSFTHPLRCAERVALLDHVSGGRVEVGVGRGYQFPQYGVFGVPIDETRAIFDEALDVVLHAWRGEEFTYTGRHFEIPNVRIWPAPIHPPGEVLLHAVNSPESMARAIGRGLPALMARPLSPFAEQVEEFARYRAALAAAGVDAAPVLARATALKYAFLAPTRAEARALAREARRDVTKELVLVGSGVADFRATVVVVFLDHARGHDALDGHPLLGRKTAQEVIAHEVGEHLRRPHRPRQEPWIIGRELLGQLGVERRELLEPVLVRLEM